MWTNLVSETSEHFHTLTRLLAREYIIEVQCVCVCACVRRWRGERGKYKVLKCFIQLTQDFEMLTTGTENAGNRNADVKKERDGTWREITRIRKGYRTKLSGYVDRKDITPKKSFSNTIPNITDKREDQIRDGKEDKFTFHVLQL